MPPLELEPLEFVKEWSLDWNHAWALRFFGAEHFTFSKVDFSNMTTVWIEPDRSPTIIKQWHFGAKHQTTKLGMCLCFDVTTHLHSGRGIFSYSYDSYAHSFFSHLSLPSSFELEPLEFFLEDEFLSGVCLC